MRFVMTYLVSYIMKAEGRFRRFLREEEGASAIEYAIIAGLIAAVIMGAVQLLGTDLRDVFTNIQTTLNPPAQG